MIITLLIIIILQSIPSFSYYKSCTELEERVKHQFYPLRHCQRSNKTIIGWENFDTAEQCAEYAKAKRGLAFNFGPKDRQGGNLFDVVKDKDLNTSFSITPKPGSMHFFDEPSEFFNCQVLACPEYVNLSSIVNDTRFDYYTLYARPPPPVNSSCLPSVGMFMLFETRSNYSTAIKTCSSNRGVLSHILSESRTNSISDLLLTAKNVTNEEEREAFVGLNETALNKFVTSLSEPIKCFQYRAWEPHHPNPNRRLPNCVAITAKRSWKVYNCFRKMMFVCEILSSGPNPYVNLSSKCSTKRPNNRFKPPKNTDKDNF